MKRLGFAQIPLMIGLLLMAVAVPVATKLVQQNQTNQGKAYDYECGIGDPCGGSKVCKDHKCVAAPTSVPKENPTKVCNYKGCDNNGKCISKTKTVKASESCPKNTCTVSPNSCNTTKPPEATAVPECVCKDKATRCTTEHWVNSCGQACQGQKNCAPATNTPTPKPTAKPIEGLKSCPSNAQGGCYTTNKTCPANIPYKIGTCTSKSIWGGVIDGVCCTAAKPDCVCENKDKRCTTEHWVNSCGQACQGQKNCPTPTNTPTVALCSANGTTCTIAGQCCSKNCSNGRCAAQGVVNPTLTPTINPKKTCNAATVGKCGVDGGCTDGVMCSQSSTGGYKCSGDCLKTCKSNGTIVSSAGLCCSKNAAYLGSSLTCVAPVPTVGIGITGNGKCSPEYSGIVNTFTCGGQITQGVVDNYNCSTVSGRQCKSDEWTKLQRNADCTCKIICVPDCHWTVEPKCCSAEDTECKGRRGDEPGLWIHLDNKHTADCICGPGNYFQNNNGKYFCGSPKDPKSTPVPTSLTPAPTTVCVATVTPRATPTVIQGTCSGSRPADKCSDKTNLKVSAQCSNGKWDYDEKLCNVAGKSATCGGVSYCCPKKGGKWTTDMSKCSVACSTCTQCPNDAGAKGKGDGDCSGETNINDASIWRSEFIEGELGTVSKNTWNADFDCDGKVTINDISIWRDNFTKSL